MYKEVNVCPELKGIDSGEYALSNAHGAARTEVAQRKLR